MFSELMTHGSEQSRRLAIKVAALSIDDQRWLLSQLPALQQQQLTALIKDVGQLGVMRDPALVNEIINAAAAAPVAYAKPEANAEILFYGALESVWLAISWSRFSELQREAIIDACDAEKATRLRELLRMDKRYPSSWCEAVFSEMKSRCDNEVKSHGVRGLV